MRMRTVLMTAQAFVGLVVGAGFATGQEVIQYFISFGAIGIPTWMGAGLMTLRVLAVGQLDVDRVSNIISLVTQLIVIAVLAAFVYTMLQLPVDTSAFNEVAQQNETPVRPWWLSGINYACMNMMLAVSMSLVIGGSLPNTREARWGGFFGVLTRAVRGVVAPPCAARARDRAPRSHPRPADAARGPATHLHPGPREAPGALRGRVSGRRRGPHRCHRRRGPQAAPA